MDITLDITKLIDDLCTVKRIHGELACEVQHLTQKNIELTKENHALRDELSALKEDLATQKALWEYSYAEKEKYKSLYENLSKATEGV